MAYHFITWPTILLHELPFYYLAYHFITWPTILLHNLPFYYIIYYFITWFTIFLRSLPFYHMIYRFISWFTILLHGLLEEYNRMSNILAAIPQRPLESPREKACHMVCLRRKSKATSSAY